MRRKKTVAFGDLLKKGQAWKFALLLGALDHGHILGPHEQCILPGFFSRSIVQARMKMLESKAFYGPVAAGGIYLRGG